MALLVLATAKGVLGAEPHRCSLWVDAVEGEPLFYGNIVANLARAKLVYLGERHRVARHHEMQARLIRDLAAQGRKLVLGLEQQEQPQQAQLDAFAAGKIDFEELALRSDWARRWSNYAQYRDSLEAARKAGAAILALNAPREVIRGVAQAGGVERLAPELRKQLPARMRLADPLYEKLLNWEMMVHAAADAKRLRPMVEAQIARDEAMADRLATFLKMPEHKDDLAIVLCGAGHVAYGLGMPARVRDRLPGIADCVVIFSASGDVELTPQELAASRPIEITHEQLRSLGRPVADYLYVTAGKE